MELRRLFDDLVRFETELWNGLDARLQQKCGVTMGALDVMSVVARTASCRVNDISVALSITVGGASQAVDRLVARGSLVRRPNPADRRSSIVELTPEGARLTAAGGLVLDDELAARFRGAVTETELDRLGAVLATLRAAGRPAAD
ncbi:MarR family winged helix-turn-helix transcriptional regulator [Streptantibioticus silvisoli]|uniref:MarR family winged helix-turn-helix transcriptional regulator n=1 Tax=Streptantibioticus silvisoli TaxID=2705255 RepID=A0ABT6VVE1_9ACTN|nr:MarR family winged helix-turn-helix transcriptional regulator [Streptantibioticus silvisoli]MDI5961251.1 MarR family winged helix-turn-helix transcriptional regulator [Streptantibioticus silvisoli]